MLLESIKSQLATPIHEATLPISNTVVKIRPFLVKEQKALLIAKESKDQKEIYRTIINVLKSCVVSNNINPETLALLDLEWLFLQLNIHSRGNMVEPYVQLTGCDESCTNKKPESIKIDLNTVDVLKNNEHTNVVPITDTISFHMKYPTFEILTKSKLMGVGELGVEQRYNLVVNCIDRISADNQTIQTNTVSEKELKELVEQLTQEQFLKLENFFNTMPKIYKSVSVTCPSCKKDTTVEFEGITSFFN